MQHGRMLLCVPVVGQAQAMLDTLYHAVALKKGSTTMIDCRKASAPLRTITRLTHRPAAFLALIVLGIWVATGLAQEAKPQGSGYPDLVAGLKATQGCLGVET